MCTRTRPVCVHAFPCVPPKSTFTTYPRSPGILITSGDMARRIRTMLVLMRVGPKRSTLTAPRRASDSLWSDARKRSQLALLAILGSPWKEYGKPCASLVQALCKPYAGINSLRVCQRERCIDGVVWRDGSLARFRCSWTCEMQAILSMAAAVAFAFEPSEAADTAHEACRWLQGRHFVSLSHSLSSVFLWSCVLSVLWPSWMDLFDVSACFEDVFCPRLNIFIAEPRRCPTGHAARSEGRGSTKEARSGWRPQRVRCRWTVPGDRI